MWHLIFPARTEHTLPWHILGNVSVASGGEEKKLSANKKNRLKYNMRKRIKEEKK